MQAIQSATINAATLIGKPEEFGSIVAGKSADIIGVVGDPLTDIRTLENVSFVRKEGRIYKQRWEPSASALALLRKHQTSRRRQQQN